MKKVIMFPGQGSQYKGMGKALFSKYSFETKLASDILGYDLEELCVNDSNRQLVKTQFTQPALYVVNYFNYKENNETPSYFIGHSLGEYNALLAAEAFSFETGLKLVKKRGELMAAASGGSMAAVLGLNVEELKQKLSNTSYSALDVANYNTPTQTVVSGPKESITSLVKDFNEQNIKIFPLAVSAPFHSRYMETAAKEFAEFLKDYSFNQLKTPVIANVTAKPYDQNIPELLSQQISGSVKWTDTIRYLMGQNVKAFEEQKMGRPILSKMTDEICNSCTPIIQEVSEALKDNVNSIFQNNAVKNTPTKDAFTGNEKLSTKLGSQSFLKDYGVKYSYVAGAMYKGTASKELVIKMGKAGMLSFLGTGGLSLKEISTNIDTIKSELNSGQAYGMNLLHNMVDVDFEMDTVKLFLEKGIKNIEAAAYMHITEPLAYFYVSGLSKDTEGNIRNAHRVLAKISRPEVAEAFMSPVPDKILNQLVNKGKVTNEQANIARQVPVSYDICVEADSGGHTDGGVAYVLLPAIQRLRDDLQNKYKYSKTIRVGLAGGIGTPQSAASAFVMGADFVLTGSINQCTVEAGTSDLVKDLLETINVQDTGYAPAGDMFEIGAKVQVLKKGVLFPARANKLYALYNQYNSLNEIPEKTIKQLEKNYFQKPISAIWEETKLYFKNKGKESEIVRAENNPRYKMALIFRWYFGFTSKIAFEGDKANKVNFQIHTGPALGAFNQWVKGTPLQSWRNRHVDEIGTKLMEETAKLLNNTLIKINQ